MSRGRAGRPSRPRSGEHHETGNRTEQDECRADHGCDRTLHLGIEVGPFEQPGRRHGDLDGLDDVIAFDIGVGVELCRIAVDLLLIGEVLLPAEEDSGLTGASW